MLIISLALGSVALAGGDKEVSVSIPVLAPLINPLPIGAVGTTAYNTQEGAHSAITSSTGVSVPHYYINVSVNGQTVPVDPFTFNR